MSDMEGCTTVRYPLLTHVFTTFLTTRVIIRAKNALCKTTQSFFWPCAPPPDVCSGAGGMRALHSLQWCPGSRQRMHLPLTLLKAEGESFVGVWALLLLLFSASVSGSTVTSRIEPGPRLCPSMREGASTSVSRYSQYLLW